jgi:hypothetical protein
MISPFCFSPPKFVMNSFSSGMMRLNPAMKKNIERQCNQKFFP